MANPQCENGYTRIANELLDALIKSCPGGSQGSVLLAVIRKTYGFHKKEDSISISQIQKATNLSRRAVIYATQNLEAKRMLIVKRKRGRSNKNMINKISIQKKYDKWVVQGISTQYANTLKQQRKLYKKYRDGVVQGIEGSARIGKKVVQILAPTKDTITKETIKKIYCAKFNSHFELFWNAFADKRGKKPAYEKAWKKIPDMTEELALKIIEGARRYAKQRKDILVRGGTPKMAQGWLTDRRWEDEDREATGGILRWNEDPDLENKA